MKGKFTRTDNLFSLCGLNCGLCPMYIRGGCGGCFTDSPCYPSCPIAPCSVRHGNVEYCYQCSEYPCKRYDKIDLHDSLIIQSIMTTELVNGMLYYSSGGGCGKPFIHIGPVGVNGNVEAHNKLENYKDYFTIYGERFGRKAVELFA